MAAPLPRRPQATAISIEDLVERARRGAVRVPPFQRGLRWKAEDVRKLFDSVYRGYPIGSLLFWKREAPADRVTFGRTVFDAPSATDAWWVVDGQQRITSLVAALSHPDPLHPDKEDPFALGYDLTMGRFVRARASTAQTWLPLNVLLDSAQLLRWLDQYPLRKEHPEHVDAALQLGKAIREYQLPAYVIDVADEETARDVFERLNSTGKRLKQDEVFDALHTGLTLGHPSRLDALEESVESLGFGRIGREWVLKVVLAVAGLDITRDRVQQLDRRKLPETLARAEAALKDTIVFLKRDVGIPHEMLLPYRLPLAVLARFFLLHPTPIPRSRELLSRWVWRGAATGYHRGDSTSDVRATFTSVAEDEEQSIQKLLGGLPPPPDLLPLGKLQEFNLLTARSRIEANALVALKPRDLNTGEPLDVEAMLRAHGAAAFQPMGPLASRLVASTDPRTRALIRTSPLRTLANRVFYPQLKRGFALDISKLSKSNFHAFMASHAIPIPQVSWSAEPALQQLALLLSARDELLSKYVLRFILSKTAWYESDRPSLESLIVPDPEVSGGH